MMINPVEMVLKTAINYIAFKGVKSGVDYVWDKEREQYQNVRAAQCCFCMNIWANNPTNCPHCNCRILKKLFREFDYFKKQEDESHFNLNPNLTMGGRNGAY
jgi:hypothetical protein